MLRSRRLHLFMNNALDVLADSKPEGKPRKNSRRLSADIPSSDQPFMTGNVRIAGVFAQSAYKKLGKKSGHPNRLPGLDRDDLGRPGGSVGHLGGNPVGFFNQRLNDF